MYLTQIIVLIVSINWIVLSDVCAAEDVDNRHLVLPLAKHHLKEKLIKRLTHLLEKSKLSHVIKKRQAVHEVVDEGGELEHDEEVRDEFSRLPAEVHEMEVSPTHLVKFPVKPPLPPPPPPELIKAQMKYQSQFHTDIKKSFPVFDFLKEAEKIKEKKEFEPKVLPPPPPPLPPPPPPPPVFKGIEFNAKNEKELKIEFPDPVVSRTRMALHFGSLLVQALTKMLGNAEAALSKYVKPKE
ncbi:hypothetical protein JYU34_014485 [Plutella xylostella]|uniref:Uncharacterized protein n=1 Tax=Plutella xylostella TaxID=51655 RepID=A0ABQ7Q9W5_PLUXY|nr:hypothetical protein JYU34_014485 [Plutella xylostella]